MILKYHLFGKSLGDSNITGTNARVGTVMIAIKNPTNPIVDLMKLSSEMINRRIMNIEIIEHEVVIQLPSTL